MATTTPNYTRLTERNASFQLLRTNPKLTTNLKLTVDSVGDLWFNSIDANSQLANQKYKRFALSPESSHEVNIHRFFDNGKTPASVAYTVGSSINKNATAKDLKDQYDFDLYTSGAKYLVSKQYSEKFSYFAPLYLDKILPTKFVIFKISGPSNYTAGQGRDIIPTVSVEQFATDLFKSATIVKVVDISPISKVGKYISNIVNNPMFKETPLYVNYKNDGYSLYRGASISSGTYVEIPEQHSTIFNRALPQLKLEQFITLGYERNKIVHPRILNLEFLFDDTTSKPYSFNRYFGFYCNEIELASLQLDLAAMFTEMQGGNDQSLPTVYSQSDEVSFTLTNPNGVKLLAKNVSTDVSDISLNRINHESLFFPFIKTKDGELHLIQSNGWQQSNSNAVFAIDDTSFDIGTAFGPGDLVTQEVVETVVADNSRSSLSIEIISQPNHLDTIRLYHPSGKNTDSMDPHGTFDDLVFVSGFFTNGEAYSIAYDSLPVGVGSQIYVNADKSINEIAQAVCDIVIRLKDSSLASVKMKTTAFLQVRAFGDTYGSLKVRILEAMPTVNSFKVNGSITTSTVYADGGFVNTPHPVIDAGNIAKIPSISDVIVRTNTNWSEIARVCNSTDSIKNGLSESDQELAISNFDNKAVIMLTDKEIVKVINNSIEVRTLYKPKIGLLSMFEIQDFDFSTYSSSYVRNLSLDLFKDFYVPADVAILDFTKYSYQIIGEGTVVVNGATYSMEDSVSGVRPLVWQNTSILSKYSVISGDAILVISKKLPFTTTDPIDPAYPDRLDIGYYDETGDAQNYVGPFSLKADHAAQNINSLTFPYREKYIHSNVSSEYHVYLENFTPDYSIDNRVVPYISKWGMIESLDARSNPYRLNTDIMFGKDNFGPSHKETSPTPEKLTHEWFYIESSFNYTNDVELLRRNYFYFESPFDTAQLISDPLYFEDYFTYIPKFNGQQVDRPQFRYSTLSKNAFTKQYETLFKGVMFRFYELDIAERPLASTSRFDDYKFTVLLKPIMENSFEVRQPVKYRVIENTDSKSITVLIEVTLGYRAQINETVFLTDWSTITGDIITQDKLFTDRLFSDINGDYRIEFNDENVSNLTHSFLYYAKNKKYNSKEKAFSTIKLSRGIDISPSGLATSGLFANSVKLTGLESYDSFADSEIEQVSNQFAPMYVISGGSNIVLVKTTSTTYSDSDLGDPSITIDGIDGAGHEVINLTPTGGTFVLLHPTATSYSPIAVPSGVTSTWKNSIQFQIFGGINYYAKVFENLSFAKFYELLDKNQSVISWESYTGGILSASKDITIEVLTADEITKQTIVEPVSDIVRAGQINGVAGFSLNEVGTTQYQVNRYSGEYEIITKPLAGYKYNFEINGISLTGSNSCLNPNVKNFFVLPDFEYVKYSKSSILDLENSQNYSSVYALIGETPIDRTDLNSLSSSWDYNYHFEYSNKGSYSKIAGSKRISEDYSFVSKLLNVPTSLIIESFTSAELLNKEYLASASTEANLVYSKFDGEVRFKLNISDLITKTLADNGLRAEFQKYFKYSDGSQIIKDSDFLGDLTFEEFLSQYCLSNLIKLYQIDSFEFYELDDRTIQDNLVQFEQVSYNSLGSLGYRLIKTVKINNTKTGVVEGSITIKPNTGVKLVPKIKIKFI